MLTDKSRWELRGAGPSLRGMDATHEAALLRAPVFRARTARTLSAGYNSTHVEHGRDLESVRVFQGVLTAAVLSLLFWMPILWFIFR